MKAGELLEIIERIAEKEQTNFSEIASKSNLDRSYLSKTINGDPGKELTERLIKRIRTKYPAYFPVEHKNNKNRRAGSHGNHTPQSDLQTILRDFTEAGIRHEAAINILAISLAELIAQKTGKSIGFVSSELQKAISSEGDRLLAERGRRRG